MHSNLTSRLTHHGYCLMNVHYDTIAYKPHKEDQCQYE